MTLRAYATLLLALASSTAAAAPPRIVPGAPISPQAPWAIAPEGPRTLLEQLYGPGIDPTAVKPLRQGTLVYGGESLARDVLADMGLPLPALYHDPTPGVLYLAMDGVTLKPVCPGAQDANAALDCSPLVDQETVFPSIGSETAKGAALQKLKNYYDAFNLVIATNRPPPYLPYTMAVIGGTSGNAGQPNGVCGIANVACDGAKRNHVSLSFPASCPGASAEIAAQETAHNWGLEHTDVQSDLMYPFIQGATQFRDECMAISHATGSGVTQCGFVHKEYCPAGDGEQQNSYGELMGVFGAREADTIAPEIVSISPADGSTFSTSDTFTVSATVADNSNFVGVRWTWLEGLPADFQDTGYTRCTNQVCTDDFAPWLPVDQPWDLLQFKGPPAGSYKFRFEVMDAYGNSDKAEISFTVTKEGGGTTSSGGDSSSSGGDPGTSGEDPTGGGGGSSEGGGSSAGPASDSGTPMTGDEGCNCRSATPPSALALLLALAGLGRRRRAR